MKEKGKPFFFPFYTADFIEGTSLMSCEEVGAYIRLLIHQFNKGSVPIGDKEMIKRITGSDSDIAFVLKKFPRGRNSKMSETLRKLYDKSEKAVLSISQRYNKTRGKTYERNTNVERTNSERNTNDILSKDKVKDTVKYTSKEDTDIVPSGLPSTTERAKTRQADFILKWSELYKTQTGHDYKADRKDYIIVANLMKKYSVELIIEKAHILFDLCEDGSIWFAKSVGDFTIEKLSSRWNNIVPQAKKKTSTEKVISDIERATEKIRKGQDNAIK